VRIGCGAGFWGDSPEGPAQLVRKGDIDYLVMDYLAEITMSILARMKAKKPELGYATDFVTMVMKPLAKEIAAKNIRVVTNAGGVNPEACRDALEAVFAEQGVKLKVAVVRGDDLSARADAYRAAGVREMFSGAAMPDRLASVNAYLGAFPIAKALDAGADVVITGRVVDSAVVLGPLIHEFGWKPTDYDLLSAGSLAGHVVECGVQATGGIFTDWKLVADDWDDMGFPIAECAADGSFVLTKPKSTGGLVSTGTVAEQIVYEVGDPRRYILPGCDRGLERGPARTGRAGPGQSQRRQRALPRPPSYKVSATFADGYRAHGLHDDYRPRRDRQRAEATATAILKRSERLMRAAGFDGFSPRRPSRCWARKPATARSPGAGKTREIVLKIAVRHRQQAKRLAFSRARSIRPPPRWRRASPALPAGGPSRSQSFGCSHS
jgi:hypothetical protein